MGRMMRGWGFILVIYRPEEGGIVYSMFIGDPIRLRPEESPYSKYGYRCARRLITVFGLWGRKSTRDR